jgi:hypothetical protein
MRFACNVRNEYFITGGRSNALRFAVLGGGSVMLKVLMAALLAMPAILTPASAAHTPYRLVTAINDVAQTFSCRASTREPTWTYNTHERTIFRVHGKTRRASFADIKVGDTVAVEYHIKGDERIADRVAIRPKQ